MVYSNICDEVRKVSFDRADSGGSRTYPFVLDIHCKIEKRVNNVDKFSLVKSNIFENWQKTLFNPKY